MTDRHGTPPHDESSRTTQPGRPVPASPGRPPDDPPQPDTHPYSFTTGRPVAILMLFLAAVVFGYFSFAKLPLTLMPEMTYPTLTVRTEYAGAAPEEVENDVSRPLEEALGVIGGLRRVSSVSRAGVSDVILEFTWETGMSDATQDVLERLDLVFLPDEAKRPLILHYDPALDPIMELSLTGHHDAFDGEPGLRRLRRLADLQIKRLIEPVKGVAAVKIKGGLEEEIRVLVDEAQLRRTGISIQQVIDRLSQENINVAGGVIQEGRTEYLVRTVNEFQDLEQIGDVIVSRFEGRDVRIRDLGAVISTHKERQIVTRTDGGESVQIEIYKEADANIVDLAHRVKALIGQVDPARADSLRARGPAAASGSRPSERSGTGSGFGRGKGGAQSAGSGIALDMYEQESAVLKVVADRSLFIESSIADVRNTAILGGLLAVGVLYLFLRHFASTAIVGVSIPVSLLVTFAPLQLLGVSLNVMSLGGLALGIGMLVDSSIVVLESIHRCREEGDGWVASAIRGTHEVRGAVVASTLTSIAVFFPMVFVEGVAGQAFGDLGLAVVVSLLASLGVALFLIPMLASRGGVDVSHFAAGENGTVAFYDRFFAAKAQSPTRSALIRWALSLPLTLLFLIELPIRGLVHGAIGLFRRIVRGFREFFRGIRTLRIWMWFLILPLVYLALRSIIQTILWTVGAFGMFVFSSGTLVLDRWLVPGLARIGRVAFWLPQRLTDRLLERLHRDYPRALTWSLDRPGVVVFAMALCLLGTWFVGSSLDSELLPEVHQGEFTVNVTLSVGTPLEETDSILRPIEEAILTEREHIEALILVIGYDPAQSEESDEGEHTAKFKVLLERSGNMAQLEEQVITRLRRRFEGIPDLDARIQRPVLFSSKTPIEVEIHGDDLDQLREVTDRARLTMQALPELADVQSTLRRGAPEVQVIYDRDRLSQFGLNIGQVARLVRDKVKGFEATRFNLVNRRIPIVVQLNDEDRESVRDIADIVVNPGGERPIPLESVAQVVLGEGPSEVRRIDGQRVGVVRANIAEASLSSATNAIREALEAQIDWPAGMTYYLSGQNEEWERSRGSLFLALGLSIFLVYVIMAAQFESLIHPFVIMFSIPLAFVGTFLTLAVLGINLSVVVFLGMIMLAGIVVNNAIVLVDYINTLRARGLDRREAVITSGTVRLRPILMTTATTVLGLLPMAMGLGDGAEIRTPMAIAVISGLLTSTILTLLIVPTIYEIADRGAERLLGVRRDRRRRLEPSPGGV